MRRRAEAERYGISAVAFRSKRGFHGVGGGGGEGIFVGFDGGGLFEVLGSGDGGIGETAESEVSVVVG